MSSVASEPYRYPGGDTASAPQPPLPREGCPGGVQERARPARAAPASPPASKPHPLPFQAPIFPATPLRQPWPSSPRPSQTQRPLPPPFSVPPPCCQAPGHSQAQLGRWALTLHLTELVLGGLLRLGAAGPTQLLLEQGRAQLGPGLRCHPSLLRQPIHSHHISSTQADLGGVTGLGVRDLSRLVGPHLSPRLGRMDCSLCPTCWSCCWGWQGAQGPGGWPPLPDDRGHCGHHGSRSLRPPPGAASRPPALAGRTE